MDEAKEEGFPTDVEEREAYFMNEVGQGEKLCQDSECLFLGSLLNILLSEFTRFEAS